MMRRDSHFAGRRPIHRARVDRCLICESGIVSPSFRVAFPDRDADGVVAWRMEADPPVAHWVIDGCANCGVHFANPMPRAEAIRSYYSSQESPNDWEMVHYVRQTD